MTPGATCLIGAIAYAFLTILVAVLLFGWKP